MNEFYSGAMANDYGNFCIIEYCNLVFAVLDTSNMVKNTFTYYLFTSPLQNSMSRPNVTPDLVVYIYNCKPTWHTPHPKLLGVIALDT